MTTGTEVTLSGVVCTVQTHGAYGEVEVHGRLTYRLMDALETWRDATCPDTQLWVREAPTRH